MGAAYAVKLVLTDLLGMAQLGSYPTPLIMIAPIPLTLYRHDAGPRVAQ